MGTPIRVEKRKWNGRVSSAESAHVVPTSPSVLAWFVRAGTSRARPTHSGPDWLECDELWLTVADEWWVLCAAATGDSITDVVVHAAVPVEPVSRQVLTWIDLDLDFEVHSGVVGLKDEDVFQHHASLMAYPKEVVRGAWSGISRLAPRYTTGEWPFNGWLDVVLARSRGQVGCVSDEPRLHGARPSGHAHQPSSRRSEATMTRRRINHSV